MKKKICLVLLVLVLSITSVFARPKVALVLSGGGAKGYVHIATLEMLEKHGIEVDYIVGTSMGSLVGALYAAGYSSSEIVKLIKESSVVSSVFYINARDNAISLDSATRRTNLGLGFDSNGITSTTGIVDDTKILNLLNRLMLRVSNTNDFDDFPRAFRAVASDINSGETVAIGEGNVVEAMRASMGIPIAFPVFKVNGRYFVDGGLKENMPIDIAKKEFNPDIIIASDCSAAGQRAAMGKDLESQLNDGTAGITSVIVQSMMVANAELYSLEQIREDSEVSIFYDTTKWGTASFGSFDEILNSSREQVKEYEHGFKNLATLLNEDTKEGERPQVKRYTDFAIPVVESVRISGSERYKPGLNKEIAAYFKDYQNILLDDVNLTKLEKLLVTLEDFYGMAYMYYVLHELPGGKNELEIKYDLPPLRKNNVFMAGNIRASFQNVLSDDESKLSFGYAIFPEMEFGYKRMLNPLKNMHNLVVKYNTTALNKDNEISVYYTHIFSPHKPYVGFIAPKLSFYMGLTDIDCMISWAQRFVYYDYGSEFTFSGGFLSRRSSLLASLGLEYLAFGEDHGLMKEINDQRKHLLRPFLEINYNLGRPDFYTVEYDTGYGLTAMGYLGVDLGADVMNNTFTEKTQLNYALQVQAEGTFSLHDYVTIAVDGQFGFSRRPRDLFASYFEYGDFKGMPGFSIEKRVHDYWLCGLSLIIPFAKEGIAIPGLSIRVAVGQHDTIMGITVAEIQGQPAEFENRYAYDGFDTIFKQMEKLNLGINLGFTLKTPIIDIVIGAGYEFFEKKFALNVEIW